MWKRRRPGDLIQKQYYNKDLSVSKGAVPYRVEKFHNLQGKSPVGEKDFIFFLLILAQLF